MVDIVPFKGVLYDQKKVPMEKVVAPPYDVISPREQLLLHKRHSVNFIRLILGKVYPADGRARNRYSRAAHLYNKWIDNGILRLDSTPSIYISRVDFREEGKKKTRLGFIALVDLRADKNKLLPHERTFSGPKKDRLNLIRACHTNFSQIFTLYSDTGKRATKMLKPFIRKRPIIRTMYNGEVHFLWKVSDRKVIEGVKKIMKGRDIFIADGHHRYEAARTFSAEAGERFGNSASCGSRYCMLYFSNMDEDGLSILPTHRMVRRGAVKKERLKLLGDFFEVISYPYSKRSFKKAVAAASVLLKRKRHSFGLLTRGKKELRVFVLKDLSFLRRFIKATMSFTKRNLATTILDQGVLEGILKIKNFEKDVSYTRDTEEAKRRLAKGDISHAFILPPASLRELKDIANLGERMPHKSTYFYPKLLSGLVTYDQERSLSP